MVINEKLFKLVQFSSIHEFSLMNFKPCPTSVLLWRLYLVSWARCASTASLLYQGPPRLSESYLSFWMAFFILAFNHRLLLCFLIMFSPFGLFDSGNSSSISSRISKKSFNWLAGAGLWSWDLTIDLHVVQQCLCRSHLYHVAEKCTFLCSPFLPHLSEWESFFMFGKRVHRIGALWLF